MGKSLGTHTATLTVSAVSGVTGSYSFCDQGVEFVQSSGATLSLITDPLITASRKMSRPFGSTASSSHRDWHSAAGINGTSIFRRFERCGNVSQSYNVLTLTGVATADAGSYYVTVQQ